MSDRRPGTEIITLVSRTTDDQGQPVEFVSRVPVSEHVLPELKFKGALREALINSLKHTRKKAVERDRPELVDARWVDEFWMHDIRNPTAFIENREPYRLSW